MLVLILPLLTNRFHIVRVRLGALLRVLCAPRSVLGVRSAPVSIARHRWVVRSRNGRQRPEVQIRDAFFPPCVNMATYKKSKAHFTGLGEFDLC